MEEWMEDGIMPRATQPADTQAGCSKHAAQATPMGLLRTLCAFCPQKGPVSWTKGVADGCCPYKRRFLWTGKQVERILCWNVDITRKGFPIAVGNDGGGRESTRRESRSGAGMTETGTRIQGIWLE